MLERFNYDIYHTSDFHGALAPLYLLPRTVPLVLTLHNAEYQGNYPLVDAAQTRRLQHIFNLPRAACEEYSWTCGTFNLMWAAVQYLQRHQRGAGFPRGDARTWGVGPGLCLWQLLPRLHYRGRCSLLY